MPSFARTATRFTCIAFLAAFSVNAFAEDTVTETWVRGTVAGQGSTGAYMKLRSTTDAALVAISSPRVQSVELHAMHMENGVMRMRAIDTLALPAGRTVELGPSGYHVMLTGLRRPLNAGEKVPLTLTECSCHNVAECQLLSPFCPSSCPAASQSCTCWPLQRR